MDHWYIQCSRLFLLSWVVLGFIGWVTVSRKLLMDIQKLKETGMAEKMRCGASSVMNVAVAVVIIQNLVNLRWAYDIATELVWLHDRCNLSGEYQWDVPYCRFFVWPENHMEWYKYSSMN
mmetsp:Transcript_16416/g.23847  ORF Transcript_16416/g.23847 Transcript_16416/m.23847 type:complete len:120 (+) Transcript_16416:484-843(+)